MNSIMYNEILNSLTSYSPLLEYLESKSILITGATGLIGKYLCFTLAELKEKYQLNVNIFANVRNENKANKLFGEYIKKGLIKLVVNGITEQFNLEEEIDYIIHGASVTSSIDFVERPVDTINIALNGTNNILNLAFEKNVKSFLFLSSLEVYGIPFDQKAAITESDYGMIDSMSVRSSYSEGKKMAETLCVAFSQQYGIPIKVARLCQTFGPGIEYADNRVFAQFARAIVEDKDIILKTTGETERNYCYITDAILGIMYVLIHGKNQEAYNIANEDTSISIKEMAELVIQIGNGSSNLIFDINENPEKLGYNPTVKINLDTKKIKKLGWTPTIGLRKMYETLIESLIEEKKRGD